MKKPEVPEAKASRTHRRFDRAFKEEAVNSWINSGKPGSVVAEELGIPANNLYNWRKAFNRQPQAPKSSDGVHSELVALRRELERVRHQRDILKKTLGILSEPPNSATNGSMR